MEVIQETSMEASQKVTMEAKQEASEESKRTVAVFKEEYELKCWNFLRTLNCGTTRDSFSKRWFQSQRQSIVRLHI